MKLIIAAIILIVLVSLVWATAAVISKGWQRRKTLRAPWTLEERTGEITQKLYLEARKPGQAPILIRHPETNEAGVAYDDPAFDLNLYILRSEGERYVEVLNDKE